MRPPDARFTMRRMMAWVAVAAVTLATARFAAARWGAEGLASLAYWVFLLSVLVPRRPGRLSMFWAGFGGFGMLYLSIANDGALSLPFRLPTGLILDFLYDRLLEGGPVSAIAFQQAGHAAFAALLGAAAGLVLATQVPADFQAPEPLPFRARVRANFPTVFAYWDALRSGVR